MLSLLLLMTQQLGLAHGVSHGSDTGYGAPHGKQLPVDQNCAKCLAFAPVGSAPISQFSLSFADAAGDAGFFTSLCRIATLRTVCPFLSRAPPLIV